MQTLFRVIVRGVFGGIVLSACNTSDNALVAPNVSVQREEPRALPLRAAATITYDDELVSLADTIPGFGGVRVTADGAIELLITKSGEGRGREGAEAITRFARAHHWNRIGAKFERIRTVPAAFGIRTLFEARKELDDASADSAFRIVWTDMDEASNRVDVAVMSSRDSARVTRFLLRSGLTAAGIRVEVASQVSAEQTVRDNVQPLRGGMVLDVQGVPGVANCTIGPWLKLVSGPLPDIDVALTNSHCTSALHTTSVPSEMYQSGQFIGWEIGDFPLSRYSGCPRNQWCRRADVAVIQIQQDVWRLNTVVNLGNPHNVTWINNGILNDPPIPLTIVDQDTVWSWNNSNLPSGTQIRKTGMRTGTTAGSILATCLNAGNINGFGTAVLTCQNRATYFSMTGDSGSPVFTWDPSPPFLGGHINLVGIHWGRFSNANGTQAYALYSPSANIRQEHPNLYDP
jgi:hypothetical protein